MLAIKRNIIYTLSITSQAFTLHLPYVLLFRNEDCFYDCLCSSVTVFLFLQLCRLDLGIQLCIYSHKTADEPRFFNWSNASDLWKRRCSHALCHLPGAIVRHWYFSAWTYCCHNTLIRYRCRYGNTFSGALLGLQ